jgi:CRP-like cAMP-binding protein
MKAIEELLREQPIFADLDPEHRALIAGCTRNHHVDAQAFLFRENDSADMFYLLRHGHVALQVTAPGRAPLVLATLGPGDIVGASWLVPPYRWNADARAVEATRALAVDAACLRAKCAADPGFGFALMQRFVPLLVQRLHATRMQLLDVYGQR